MKLYLVVDLSVGTDIDSAERLRQAVSLFSGVELVQVRSNVDATQEDLPVPSPEEVASYANLLSAIFGTRNALLPNTDAALFVHLMKQSLDDIPDREREIIKMHLGMGEWVPGLTFRGIGERYGLTYSQAASVFNSGLRKLRHPIRSRRIRQFVRSWWEEEEESV